MAQVFWLVLAVPSALLHVGNFPTMASCQAAAKAVWSYQSTGGSGDYTAFCVKATTGKQGDPAAP